MTFAVFAGFKSFTSRKCRMFIQTKAEILYCIGICIPFAGVFSGLGIYGGTELELNICYQLLAPK